MQGNNDSYLSAGNGAFILVMLFLCFDALHWMMAEDEFLSEDPHLLNHLMTHFMSLYLHFLNLIFLFGYMTMTDGRHLPSLQKGRNE